MHLIQYYCFLCHAILFLMLISTNQPRKNLHIFKVTGILAFLKTLVFHSISRSSCHFTAFSHFRVSVVRPRFPYISGRPVPGPARRAFSTLTFLGTPPRTRSFHLSSHAISFFLCVLSVSELVRYFFTSRAYVHLREPY